MLLWQMGKFFFLLHTWWTYGTKHTPSTSSNPSLLSVAFLHILQSIYINMFGWQKEGNVKFCGFIEGGEEGSLFQWGNAITMVFVWPNVDKIVIGVQNFAFYLVYLWSNIFSEVLPSQLYKQSKITLGLHVQAFLCSWEFLYKVLPVHKWIL